jgi:hypothetical protein
MHSSSPTSICDIKKIFQGLCPWTPGKAKEGTKWERSRAKVKRRGEEGIGSGGTIIAQSIFLKKCSVH